MRGTLAIVQNLRMGKTVVNCERLGVRRTTLFFFSTGEDFNSGRTIDLFYGRTIELYIASGARTVARERKGEGQVS